MTRYPMSIRSWTAWRRRDEQHGGAPGCGALLAVDGSAAHGDVPEDPRGGTHDRSVSDPSSERSLRDALPGVVRTVATVVLVAAGSTEHGVPHRGRAQAEGGAGCGGS